jgi:hypothetical protein
MQRMRSMLADSLGYCNEYDLVARLSETGGGEIPAFILARDIALSTSSELVDLSRIERDELMFEETFSSEMSLPFECQ